MQKISKFLFEHFQLLVVKFSIYMNRRVFVLDRLCYLIVVFLGIFYTVLNHVTRRCHIKLNTMVLSHYLNTKTVINSFGAKFQTTFVFFYTNY